MNLFKTTLIGITTIGFACANLSAKIFTVSNNPQIERVFDKLNLSEEKKAEIREALLAEDVTKTAEYTQLLRVHPIAS